MRKRWRPGAGEADLQTQHCNGTDAQLQHEGVDVRTHTPPRDKGKGKARAEDEAMDVDVEDIDVEVVDMDEGVYLRHFVFLS
jgi:hypothetical protein